ncbi:hypothetical protein BSP109_01955 [Brevibacterium sp. Mu109]|uniref:hypothetical protein n=1 Tax=Brevibacterium sp. Mu109 TaxID=1255669 RepID=UPI000C6C0963|nr:hypothetical protein [Brevibacterium sp. Mu109]SMX84511.1 hypothetical protein BSP109_01955 [Brevibacterium sp. Mu109]
MFTFAIGIAVIAALCLALGTHLQHRAVSGAADTHAAVTHTPTAGTTPPPPRRLVGLLRSPLWLVGLGLLALETGLNMVALGLAPVALVQPIGTLSLVAAVVLGSRTSRSPRPPARSVLGGIGLTLLSTGLFVGVSAQWSTAPEAAAPDLLTLTFLLLGIAGLGTAVALSAVGHAARIVTAGVLFGLVATGAHALLHALAGSGAGSWVAPAHVVLLIGLIAGSIVGMWIVQTAYASGPPETVLAGLTVIDPLTAVVVGAAVLGEYSTMPLLVVLVLLLTGASAVAGVLLLVRVHPDVVRTGSPVEHQSPTPARQTSPPRQTPPARQPAPALHGAQPTDTRE